MNDGREEEKEAEALVKPLKSEKESEVSAEAGAGCCQSEGKTGSCRNLFDIREWVVMILSIIFKYLF